METMLWQKSAVQIVVCGITPIERKIKLDWVDLTVAYYAVCRMFLHNDCISAGRDVKDHILRHLGSLIVRHHAASFPM